MIFRAGLLSRAISADGNATAPGRASTTRLSRELRVQVGREPEPSAAVIDSQSVKTSPVRGDARDYDAGKKIWGRKRHLLVDTLGLLICVKVLAADITDREGGKILLTALSGKLPRLLLIWADSG
jgi:putative transposase